MSEFGLPSAIPDRGRDASTHDEMEAVLARGSNSVHDKTGHYHISFGGLQGNFGVERLGKALFV